jgi:uncharacterized protein (DUF305 family)
VSSVVRGAAAWLAAAAIAAVLSSCRSSSEPRAAIVQPGAPGEGGRVVDARAAADLTKVQFTPADVRFMQGMIGHHSQALEMTTLAGSHTTNDAIRKIALRIELSQADEIKMMQEWLARRGQPLPDPHAHHAAGAVLMPGMLTAAEMEHLAAAHDAEFDRLFLESMIKHHEGALVMVRDLFAQPRAGQEADVFAFASDVEADQRMEIDRMRAVLAAPKEPVR